MLRISNDQLTVVINLERGAEIVEVARTTDGINVLAYGNWGSPVPAGGNTAYYSSGLDWLSGHRGGWQETLPNAGLASEVDGVPLPFHGEGSVIPWRAVEVGDAHCVLQTDLRLPLRATRSMSVSGTALHVKTEVTNTSIQAVPMVWGHHPAFAADSETTLHLPSTRYELEPSMSDRIDSTRGLWPTADAGGEEVDLSRFGSEGGQRLVYCHGHEDGWAVLRQGAGRPSVALSWDVDAYPAIWVWQNRRQTGFPWFGRLQCLGVEPQRAWPFDGLAGARARGQELVVEPGETATAWLTLALPAALPDRILGVDSEGRVHG